MYITLFLYPFIYLWNLCCFYNLVIMNNAGMYWYMRMQLSVWDLYFNSFGCISRSGVVGSYGSFTFNVLSNIHTSFHSSYVSLHPHQQCRRVPHLPHSCQHLLSFFLSFYLFNPCYLIVALICISLMINDVEQLFMYPLAIWMSCLEKMSIKVLCQFLNWIICFLMLSCMNSLCILDINPLSDMVCNFFFLFLTLLSHSVDYFLSM